MDLSNIDYDDLPPEVQKQLVDLTLNLFKELGIKPRIHAETGEHIYTVEDVAAGLGVEQAEIFRLLSGREGMFEVIREDSLLPNPEGEKE